MPNKASNATPPREPQTKLHGGSLDLPLVAVLYQTYCSLHELVLKFPKSQRYTLGDTCQRELLAILEAIISAANASDAEIKIRGLRVASAKLDMLRLLVRLAKDCKCLSNQAYLDLESKLHEAGRMLGGWIKSL